MLCQFYALQYGSVFLNSALCQTPGKDVFAQTLFILCVINMKTNKYSVQFDPMPG